MRAFRIKHSIPHLAAILLASICLALPGDAATGRTSFPLSANDGGYYVTPVSVNGAPELPAIVDTAATIGMIAGRAASAAGIEAPGAESAEIPVFGLLGERMFPLVQMDGVRLGGVHLNRLSAAYNNREQMPGSPVIIPATILGGDIIDFNFPVGQLSVYDGRPDRVSGSQGRIRLNEENGLFFVEITVNGVKGKGLIDTGSPLSIINSKMAQMAKAQVEAEKTGILRGATGGRLAVSVVSLRRIGIDKFTYRNQSMVVVDPALFDELGLSDEPAMLIGLDILSHFRVQIDRRRGEILLTPDNRNRDVILNLDGRLTRIRQ